MPYTILVGGYSNFISTLTFDPTTSPTTLKVVGTSPAGSRPSWISRHPTDKSLIFATNELVDGKVLLFTLKPDQTLDLVQTMSSGGAAPCHMYIGENEVVVANVSIQHARPQTSCSVRTDSRNADLHRSSALGRSSPSRFHCRLRHCSSLTARRSISSSLERVPSRIRSGRTRIRSSRILLGRSCSFPISAATKFGDSCGTRRASRGRSAARSRRRREALGRDMLSSQVRLPPFDLWMTWSAS